MITLFKVNTWNNEITEISATRVTESRYYYSDGRRKETWSPLNGQFSMVFKSHEEAVAYLRTRIKTTLDNTIAAMNRAQQQYNEFNEKYPEQ